MFFYLKRDLDVPAVEPIGLKTYMLVRVGLNVRPEEWFGLKLGDQEIPDEEETDCDGTDRDTVEFPDLQKSRDSMSSKVEKEGIFHTLLHFPGRIRAANERRRNIRLEKERKQTAWQERERLLAGREARIHQAEEAVRKLASELSLLADEPGKCCCVYENGVRKAVVSADGRKERILPVLWRRYLEWEEFQGYRQRFWVEQLFSQAVSSHYVILGTAPCVYELIEEYARRMKSLQWILAEADYSEELLDFVEDFYTEYGLAINLQTFEAGGLGKRFRLSCKMPSGIVDFSMGISFVISDVAEGSVWMDMVSEEEKRSQILVRNEGIKYLSMKEIWKKAERRCRAFYPVL